MSDSSPPTSHSQKIKFTISPNLCWLSLWNIHHTRFGNISKRIDGILAWIYTEIHCPDLGCTCWKYSRVEKAQDVSPRLLSLLPFLNFNHVHLHIQPYTTDTIQTLYHIFGGICQSFFLFSLVALVSSDIRVNASSSAHYLATIYRRRPNKGLAKCKYDRIVHSGNCRRY